MLFIGEMASDCRGPRREFLSNVFREIMTELCSDVEGSFIVMQDRMLLYIHQRPYYVAELIIGETSNLEYFVAPKCIVIFQHSFFGHLDSKISNRKKLVN